VARPVQPAVEIVNPGVIWALEADELPALLGNQRRSSMTAEVVERANDAILAADDDQTFTRDLGQELRPLDRQILFAANANPASGKPRFLLVGKHLGIVKDARWQHCRPDSRPSHTDDIRRTNRRFECLARGKRSAVG
jgi:hypothetical protein